MSDVVTSVLGTLLSALAPQAVAVAETGPHLDEIAQDLAAIGGLRVDRVAQAADVAADVGLVVAGLADARWPRPSHAVTLLMGENAFALNGPAMADLGALLADYSDARAAALEDRLAVQAAEIAELRAQLRVTQAPLDVVVEATTADPEPATDPAADRREAEAEARFNAVYVPSVLLAAIGRPNGTEHDLTMPLRNDAPRPDHLAFRPGSVAYVLPGISPGGSGGAHSVVQEALGLAGLGIHASLFVPADARSRVEEVYPDAVPILADYRDSASLAAAVADVDVVVATEYTSVDDVVAATRRTGALAAYYVQDYEPLFAPDGSARSDGAVLSYRADPGLRLFAKTPWLANVVTARHGIPVSVVTPSIDGEVFHPSERLSAGIGPVVRVAAMVRPRTPRRRPAATVRLLAALQVELGAAIEVVTFGCEPAELKTLAGGVATPWEHLGVLPRRGVAELLRGSDVFIDLSVYQAFGRTGCEAMASGAVPVLPRLGGVTRYARNGVDAVLLDGGDRDQAFAEVVALVSDRERLQALGASGQGRTLRFSVEAAARSIRAFLATARAERSEGSDGR